MTNYLQEEMRKEFNQRKNYDEILSKMEGESTMKIVKWRYVLIPVTMVIILLAGVIGMNIKRPNEIPTNPNLKIALSINQLKELGNTSLDADVKIISIKKLPEEFQFMNQLKLLNELKLKNAYTVYTKDNIKNKEYTILHDYVFSYTSSDNKKSIQIAFSKIEKPLRDYFFNDIGKESEIGDTKLMISQYNNMYIATFEKDSIYFDIETEGITQEELVDLLISIIQ